MEISKKTYQEPEVTKVEFDFNEVIATSGCIAENSFHPMDGCFD